MRFFRPQLRAGKCVESQLPRVNMARSQELGVGLQCRLAAAPRSGLQGVRCGNERPQCYAEATHDALFTVAAHCEKSVVRTVQSYPTGQQVLPL